MRMASKRLDKEEEEVSGRSSSLWQLCRAAPRSRVIARALCVSETCKKSSKNQNLFYVLSTEKSNGRQSVSNVHSISYSKFNHNASINPYIDRNIIFLGGRNCRHLSRPALLSFRHRQNPSPVSARFLQRRRFQRYIQRCRQRSHWQCSWRYAPSDISLL